MNPVLVGGIGFVVLLILMFLRMPIGFAMGLVGFFGSWYVGGLDMSLSIMGRSPYATAASYNISIIALFVLMGDFAFQSGLSRDLYNTAQKWIGHWPGGLALATTAACGGFAAICGSSVATAATMGMVALPEMKKFRYDSGLATGCVAAGGTLGILIPPSLGFVIYGILTETSIGKLLIAGIIPGIVLMCLFMLTIYVLVRRNPHLAPPAPRATYRERLVSLRPIWAMALLVLAIIGGIYTGIFSPNEAAGVGAFVALLLGLIRRGFTKKSLYSALTGTIQTTAMILVIVIGAVIFSYFLALTTLPLELARLIGGLQLPSSVIMAAIIILYLILGCMLDVFGMIVLTVPIIFPIVMHLGFDPIWFGVIMVIMMEQAFITPPVGVNVFVIAGVAKDVPMRTIFRGILPFWVTMMVCVVILIVFPQIALFLPATMK